ncbi:hypothetical protein [Mycoplasma struthionis]|uniref:Uncharacterized protein n=1 Tax=Mycoplasma struthionis TaxID=538220 RepID=A0A502M7I6_9MOLU|nr:hypothetical protein [Mycoplasma struthionis]TPI01902.1 hypothetical protein FJM01_01400 [Mycoplasma struthionis]
MAIILKNDRLLVIQVSNSVASEKAQHFDTNDTFDYGYYMNGKQEEIKKFFNNFEGEFYINFSEVYSVCKDMFDDIKNNGLETVFKSGLIVQEKSLECIHWLIITENSLIPIKKPSINENNEYLKFDNMQQAMKIFRNFCLGDLTDIYINKIGHNGYILSVRPIENY